MMVCPNRQCGVALDPSPDGCSAMHCSVCNTYFCFLCFSVFKNSALTHAHVRACEDNPLKNLFASHVAGSGHKKIVVKKIRVALHENFGPAWRDNNAIRSVLRNKSNSSARLAALYRSIDGFPIAADDLLAGSAAQNEALRPRYGHPQARPRELVVADAPPLRPLAFPLPLPLHRRFFNFAFHFANEHQLFVGATTALAFAIIGTYAPEKNLTVKSPPTLFSVIASAKKMVEAATTTAEARKEKEREENIALFCVSILRSFDFHGRSSLREFKIFCASTSLFNGMYSLFLLYDDDRAARGKNKLVRNPDYFTIAIFSLETAAFVPLLFRRFHDTGTSMLYHLALGVCSCGLWIISATGTLFAAGDAGVNAYGEAPYL